jgi:ribosomal protein S5
MIAIDPRAARALAVLATTIGFVDFSDAATAQSGYFASIAYSQSTGRVGYSARQARTKDGADQLAIRMCAAPDAKVFMWGRDQWVAIAVVEGHVGTAGFGRGNSANEAQRKALAECSKRAHENAYRVVLCVHSSGQRVRETLSVAGKPPTSRTGFFAAIAFSPSTGKIGVTSGKAKSLEEAKQLALKDCDAPDAKVFMWGDLWIAVATAPDKPGVAGFGPGVTREEAEKAALEQAAKYAKGAAVKIERAIYSTGEEDPEVLPASATQPTRRGPVPTPATDGNSRLRNGQGRQPLTQ